MGLLNRIRSRSESKASPGEGHAATTPDHKVKDDSTSDNDSEEYSDDDDAKDEPDGVPDVLDDGSVWLDALKVRKQKASVIVDRSTKRVHYTLAGERYGLFNMGSGTLFYRGEVPLDKEERDAAAFQPYAIFKPEKVEVRSRVQGAELVKMKSHKFLYSSKWYKGQELFTVNGTEYRLKTVMKSWSGKIILTLSDDEANTPLCMFRPTTKLRGPLKTTIEILPLAISTTEEPKQHALMHNGEGTELLDLAVMAECIWRYNVQQASAAAAASSSAAASAAVAASTS